MSARCCAGLAWIALVAVLFGACRRDRLEVEVVVEDEILDRLETVEQIAGSPRAGGLAAPTFEIDLDRRHALFQPAPSTLRISGIASGPDTLLRLAPSMVPDGWSRTDGARAQVLCQGPNGAWRWLARLDLDPRGCPEDRVWQDLELSLAGCSTPTTEVFLRADCGGWRNCAADWVIWGAPRAVRRVARRLAPRRLVVLISVDTLRPDRLGLYGAPRAASPHLDHLAAEAVVFDTVVAPAPWTIPSHASLFASVAPQVHGADTASAIAEGLPLLAEVLHRAGWQTAAFVDTPALGAELGFARGFSHFERRRVQGAKDPRRGARITRGRVLDWLAEADRRPAFVFWHLMDVHGPYGAAAPFGGRWRRPLREDVLRQLHGGVEVPPDPRLEQLRRLGYHDYLELERYLTFEELEASYDEGIAEVDAELGAFFIELHRAGIWDDTLVVVTSDHGESFFEHGIFVGHSLFLTDTELRVPLLVKLPGGQLGGRRVQEMVRLTDVAPTILDAVGVAAPVSFEGHSLIDPEPGAPATLSRYAFAHSAQTGATAVRTRDHKFISQALPGAGDALANVLRPAEGKPPGTHLLGEQTYDLRADPAEATPLVSNELTERLRRGLLEHVAACLARREALGSAEPLVLPQETWEDLRTLGYVQ